MQVYALTGGVGMPPLIPTVEASHLKRRPATEKEKVFMNYMHQESMLAKYIAHGIGLGNWKCYWLVCKTILFGLL
jgi:hypothetical protein